MISSLLSMSGAPYESAPLRISWHALKAEWGGVLYEVPDFLIERKIAVAQNRKSLDAIEGEGTNYKRETIEVRRDNRTIITALTYRVQNPTPHLKTSLEYVGYIVKGLREHGVRDDYITQQVKTLAATNNPGIAAQVKEL